MTATALRSSTLIHLRTARAALCLGLLLLAVTPIEAPARQDGTSQKDQAIAQGRSALAIPLFESARDHFRRAARLDRRDPVPHIWLARTEYLERKGDLGLALKELDAALKLDPGNLEAEYWQARVLQRRDDGDDIKEAQDLYRSIVEDQPLYRDALARLQATHVELGTLPEYLAERTAAAREGRSDPVLRYRWAEALRQSGDLARAEALFRGLRETDRDFAPGRVLYSLALDLFEQQRWEDGTKAYQDAITFMVDGSVADTMWEDIYLIADLSEAQEYRQAQTVEAKREMLRGFWRSRDPDRTSVDNERIGIHYERLQVAWRNYRLASSRRAYNDPDQAGLLRLPPTYDIESPFDDMGIIYLRHGKPDDISTLQDVDVVDNASWLYEAKGSRQRMIVHFEKHALGGGWRFVPMPRPGDMAISRTDLDPKFGALQYGSDPQTEARLAEEGNRDLREALTHDSYIPEAIAEAEPLTVLSDMGFYKGAAGRTRVELYWQFPVSELINEQVAQSQESSVKVSISVFTKDFQREVYKNSRTERLPIPRGTPPNAFIFDQEVMALPPGDYQVSLRVDDLVGNKFQIQNIPDVPVPAYPSEGLALSTIEIASTIREGEQGRFVKPGYTVVPLPSRTYLAGGDVQIYFGIYNLKKDDVNATRYRIAYTLEPLAGEGGGTLGNVSIGGLLGRRNERGGITVTNPEESGILSDVHKVLSIDLAGSSFTRYRLRVTVEDLVANTTTQQTSFFYILRR